MGHGGYIEPSRLTVAEHLDGWLKHVKSQVSPRTHCGDHPHAHRSPARGRDAHQVASAEGVGSLRQGAR